MKIWTILAVLSLLCFGPRAGAASQQTLLPQFFGGFTASGTQTQLSANDLEKVAGAPAGIIREYGLTSAEQASYSQGQQTADVVLYQMADPSAAFGLFTCLRAPEMTSFNPSQSVSYAARGRDRTLLVIGNLVLDITSGRPANADLKALADDLHERADRAPYPIIAGFLPHAGLLPNTEHYVLGPQALAGAFPIVPANAGDWIGFDKNAEAIIARYHLQGQPKGADSWLLIALYPTQQVAAEKYGQLGQWVSLIDQGTPDGKPLVYGKQSGSLVALLGGDESRDSAEALLGQIEYRPQVTWNEPTHELTDPSIPAMVVGAIMGTGTIMLLAIAAGVGFGGIRLFTKFLFPGKVFDRDEQVEILQLGLSGKRIEAKDFYLIDSSKGS